MAMITYKTYLCEVTSGTPDTYTKIVDIKSFPDINAPGDPLETTTLSDGAQTFIEGIKKNSQFEFTANYDKTIFSTINGYGSTAKNVALIFGGTEGSAGAITTGSDGYFTWSGTLSASIQGKGVNEVMEMTITCTPASVPVFH